MRVPGGALGVLAVVFVASAPCARGAEMCAPSPAGIEFALAVAQSNAQDDFIRIVAGTHALTTNLHFATAEPHGLTISGGWNEDCTLQTEATSTLDGGDAHWILRLYSSVATPISVSRLTFLDGRIQNGGSHRGAGLSVQSAGSVFVERCRFYLNESSGWVGGLSVMSAGMLVVRNNVMLGNRAMLNAGAELIGNGAEAYVVGNTVVANTATEANAAGGLYVGGSAHFNLGNNLLWSNSAVDLRNVAIGSLVQHNDFDVRDGQPFGPGSGGNLSVAPAFATGLLDLHLDPHSPLVNAGLDAPPGGSGSSDADGRPRAQGAHVDIGAYETDVIFHGPFEALPTPLP